MTDQALDVEGQLGELVRHQGSDSLSIVMPTYAKGRNVNQNAIRFKNLVRDAMEQLTEGGTARKEIESQFKPLMQRQRDDHFWQHQTAGLALYVHDGHETVVHLRRPPIAAAYLADHFLIRPVALDAAGSQRVLVLAVSWERARLLEAGTAVSEIESDLFPVELREVILPPDTEEQLQYHSQRVGIRGDTAMYHGQGEGEDQQHSDRLRFLAEVGGRLSKYIGTSKRDFVLVATDEVCGHFETRTELTPRLHMAASPDGLNAQQLQSKVLEALEANKGNHQKLGEQLGTALSHGKASKDLAAILQAATEGRVQYLLVDSSQHVWGSWDEQQQSVELANEKKGVELTNLAILRTLQSSGEIIECESGFLGETHPVAAIFRY